MLTASKTTARDLQNYIPGELVRIGIGAAWTDVLVAIYRRDRSYESYIVPAVAEPMIVWVTSGTARFEEREIEGSWTTTQIQAGDFFLTTSASPYEVRWHLVGSEPLETFHAYIALPMFARAVQEVRGTSDEAMRLREISGERDSNLIPLLSLLRQELLKDEKPGQQAPSRLYISGITQTLAIYLVRNYPAVPSVEPARRGGLSAFKLHRALQLLEAELASEFDLSRLARDAGMSEFHFSRVFKRTTGLSPSQYFIRLRIARAQRLLRETNLSTIEIALEVGYSSPSHFTHVFRRETGVTPGSYRDRR